MAFRSPFIALLLASAAFAQNSTSSSTTGSTSAATTVPLLIGTPGATFAASVINACPTATTYALSFNDEYGAQNVQLTEGPSTLAFSTATALNGASAIAGEVCKFGSDQSATCTFSVTGGDSGTTIASAFTSTLAMSDLNTAQVPITAGAEKLTASGSCAAPSSTGNAGVKNVVGMGAAGLAGLAGLAML